MKQNILEMKFVLQIFVFSFMQKGRCILFKLSKLSTCEQFMPRKGNLITTLD